MYKNIKEPVKSNLPSDTFFDWLNLENIFKAWFSVGVLYLGDDYPKVSQGEIEKLDYIGVRGVLSKKFLEDHFWTYNSKIDIVPDIGWIFPRFVPDYIDVLKSVSEKTGLNIEKNNYIIFNTNHSAVEEAEIEDIKDRLAEFSKKTNLTVLILPVISSYEDSDFLTKFKNDYNILLPSNLSLKEKAALLCGAKFYIGSSLQLSENSTSPLNMDINDLSVCRTVKEVLDTLCLIKQIHNEDLWKYEYSHQEVGGEYFDLEKSQDPDVRYYACVVDKNRAGAKPKVVFRLNLAYNEWVELGYVRLKSQDKLEESKTA